MNIQKLSLDFLYPPRCPVCGEIIDSADREGLYEGNPGYKNFVHKDCFEKLPFIIGNVCEKCGILMDSDERYCTTCRERERFFDSCRGVFLYDGAAREAILNVKYLHKKEYCDFFSYAACERLSDRIGAIAPDVILPVPVHPDRMKKRGYNQAAVLARGISSYTGIPVREDILGRNKNTQMQKALTPAERKRNLADAFTMEVPLPEGTRVLLVDDIYTTGATVEACAALLKQNGASRVDVLCITTASNKNASRQQSPV